MRFASDSARPDGSPPDVAAAWPMGIEAEVLGDAEVRVLMEGSCQSQRKTSTVAGVVQSQTEKQSWRLRLLRSTVPPASARGIPPGSATVVTTVDDPARLPEVSAPAQAEVAVRTTAGDWEGTGAWRSSPQGWEIGPLRLPGSLVHRTEDFWLHLAALGLPEPEQPVALAPVEISPYIDGRNRHLRT